MGNANGAYSLVPNSSANVDKQSVMNIQKGSRSHTSEVKTSKVTYTTPPPEKDVDYDKLISFAKLISVKADHLEYGQIRKLLTESPGLLTHDIPIKCTAFKSGHGRLRPVFVASVSGSIRLLKLMIECGADIFLRQKGITLMEVACLSEKLDMVDFLLGLGFDPLEPGNETMSPIAFSAKRGCFVSVRHLLEHPSITGTPGLPNLLFQVVRTPDENVGHLNLLEYLISKGCNVNGCATGKTSKSQMTYLMHAALNGNPGILYVLLLKGAKIDAVDAYGNTALHAAARKGNGECASSLMLLGADSTIKNKAGRTSIREAMIHGHGRIALDIQRHVEMASIQNKLSELMSICKPVESSKISSASMNLPPIGECFEGPEETQSGTESIDGEETNPQ